MNHCCGCWRLPRLSENVSLLIYFFCLIVSWRLCIITYKIFSLSCAILCWVIRRFWITKRALEKVMSVSHSFILTDFKASILTAPNLFSIYSISYLPAVHLYEASTTAHAIASVGSIESPFATWSSSKCCWKKRYSW